MALPKITFDEFARRVYNGVNTTFLDQRNDILMATHSTIEDNKLTIVRAKDVISSFIEENKRNIIGQRLCVVEHIPVRKGMNITKIFFYDRTGKELPPFEFDCLLLQ